MANRPSQEPNARTPGRKSGSNAGRNGKRNGRNGANRDGALADRRLVDRCLAGDQQAWRELYRNEQPGLLKASRCLLGPSGTDGNLVEEIAARVWFALVRQGGKALSRFDPARDRHLSTFLRGMARLEVLQLRRSESRRRTRESEAGRVTAAAQGADGLEAAAWLNEFVHTLTPGELDFMEGFLLSLPDADCSGDTPDLSPANYWQRRHRLRMKLEAFLGQKR